MFLFNIWKLSQTQSYIVIGLAAVAFLCLIGIIVLSVKSKNATKNEIVNENKPVEDIQIAEEKEVNNVENQNLDNETEALKQATDEANKDNTDSDSTDVSEASILNQTNNVENVESDEANDISADSLEQKNEENNEGIEENSQNQDDTPDLSNIKTITKTNSFIKVSYLKSYRAKVSMALDTVRDYYRIIKEHCLKYGLKSRMSWGCETIYKGRKAYLKLTIRGKNLNVNLALNPNDFENTKYFYKDTSDSKKYEMVPMRVKVKSSRSLKYALELIDIMMQNAGLEQNEKYSIEFEVEGQRSLDENLKLGLIKKVESIVEDEKLIHNNLEDELEDEDDEEDNDEDEMEENTEAKADSSMPLVLVNYLKSFRAKLSMASEDARSYYEIVKNHLLSYKLKSRMSWGCETIYKGRIPYAKLTIRGKNLNVNLALNPNDFENTKYYFKDTRDSKKYEMVPMRVKVKSPRSLKYALELIDIMMANNNFKKNEAYETINTAEPIRSFDANLALGLIKKVKGRKASLEEIVENRISDEVEGDSYQDDYPDDMDELVIDSEILEMVWEIVGTHPKKGKKSIINLDDINAAYEDNEIVSKDSLKEKKLISSNIGQVKCLARGRLSKALIFQLEDYSLQAIEKILLSGGEIR